MDMCRYIERETRNILNNSRYGYSNDDCGGAVIIGLFVTTPAVTERQRHRGIKKRDRRSIGNTAMNNRVD